MNYLLLLGAAFLLILANGFFVAAEFGLVTVERSEAERAAADGDHRAHGVVAALRELSFQLSGTQLGITITSLVVGMLAEPALSHLLAGPLTGLGLPAPAAPGVAVVAGMLAASAVQMVIGELVPKNWAVSRPFQVVRVVAGPQRVFSRVFRPVILLLNGAANHLVRALGVEPTDELASARTPTELVSLARHSALAGAIEQDTADLFVRTLNLGELTAQSVMTARVKVSALEDTTTAADVLNLTRATGLSRFPVYRERLDEVVGMVHLKDALAVPAGLRDRTPVGRIAVAPLLVPETLPVQPLLERLRNEQPIAVVVDEYGGTAGRGDPGGHRRGTGRRGARRARRRGRRPARAVPGTGPGRPPGVGRRRQLPGRHPHPDRPRRAAGTVRDRGRPGRRPARPHPGTGGHRAAARLAAAGAGGRPPPGRAGPAGPRRDRAGDGAMTFLQLLLAVVLVLANGFFVGAEFALVSVRRSQIEPLAAGHRRARTVLHGLERLPHMMAAAQFGVTICSLTLGAVAEPTVARLLEPVFAATGLPGGLVHPFGYVIALAVVVFLHLVIGELVPKNLAMAAPEKAALWLGPGLVAFAGVFHPVIVVLGACARLVLRLFRVEPRDEVEAAFTSEQLNYLVEDSGQAGFLDPGEQERLSDALELGSRPVTDVLLEPSQLITVSPSVTPSEVEQLTVRTGYSRYPVAGPDGGFLGYLHVKDVLELQAIDEGGQPVPARLWRRMTTLRADLPLDDALTAMRRAASHLAAVAGPDGQVLGLVTLEDVLELLVGEVRDPAHRQRATAPAEPPLNAPRAGSQPSAMAG